MMEKNYPCKGCGRKGLSTYEGQYCDGCAREKHYKPTNMREETKGGSGVHIDENGFTFWNDGIIVLDCPLARAESDLDVALVSLKILHHFLLNSNRLNINKKETTQ